MTWTQNAILALLQLPGVGNRTANRVIQSSGPVNCLESLKDALSSTAITLRKGTPTTAALRAAWDEGGSILEIAAELGFQIITRAEGTYPRRIPVDSTDTPPVLFATGRTELLNHPHIIALVGTRRPTPDVEQYSRRIGQRVAEGRRCVLSGLALGCDTEAHRGALDVRGATIAVLPTGLDTIYPAINRRLANNILETGGCLVTEYPPGTAIAKFRLVARDRLQAVLSDAVIVAQSARDGGSMHAARHAAMLGRNVAALIGAWQGDAFSGNHAIIDGGGTPIKNGVQLEAFLRTVMPESAPICRAVLFDLDDTLIDSSSLRLLRQKRDWDGVWKRMHSIAVSEGVTQMLARLRGRGMRVGIVSSAPRRYVQHFAAQMGPMDVVKSYHDTQNHKPHPEPLLSAVSDLGLTPAEALYVGDADCDEKAARAAGVHFLRMPVVSDVRVQNLDELYRLTCPG